MNIEDAWEKALSKTEIIRARVEALKAFSQTHVPYVLLSASSINIGDTVVRKGEIIVEKPSLIVPPHNPQFMGFNFEEAVDVNQNSLVNFLLVRGISLPSLRYDNKTSSLEIFEGEFSKAIDHYNSLLQRKENIKIGLISGPEDVWQLSLLIFICYQISRNAEYDVQRLLEEYHKKKNEKKE